MASDTSVLIGISLSCETHLHDLSQDTALGLVISNNNHTSLADFRQIAVQQCHLLPSKYIFITPQGWPITEQQEKSLCLSQVLSKETTVRIQKCYEHARIGISVADGRAVGFIFIDHDSDTLTLRSAIRNQLGDQGVYLFLDRNGWPVSGEQEQALSLIDLVKDGGIKVIYANGGPAALSDSADGVLSLSQSRQLSAISFPEETGNSMKQLTFQEEKDVERHISIETDDSIKQKDILISYVRAEAAQHAVFLKKALIKIGFSVFLDVHEIKYGVDWQDALNHAVSNCEVFVPLVTPRYGETQWTNREVKLADVLSKFILPVNFLDYWPPKCLAIQFATTQYIPWKPPEHMKTGQGKSSCPGKCLGNWDDKETAAVATEIGERLRVQAIQFETFPHSNINRKMSMLRSCPASLPVEFAELSQHREGQPLIVISLHPQQKQFGESLKENLEDVGYEVWCTTELLQDYSIEEDARSDVPLFSQDSLKDGKQLSFPSHTPPVYYSQMSELSQHSDDNSTNPDFHLKFQEKADEAGLVLFVLSKAFAHSRTSQMHVYYCEHRKRVISLRYEEFPMPGWLSMLIGTGVFEDVNAASFKESLMARVKKAIEHPQEDLEDEVSEVRLSQEVHKLKSEMPKETFVYIAGGTKFYNPNSENICIAIGKALAHLENIHIATGGFYGVGETVGKSYNEERVKCEKPSFVWHILPHRDEQDRSKQANQNEDKTFQPIPYGTTLYSGGSVRDREKIVSRAFDTCILVEGGPGAAHEAEQFSWNDHVVIPVQCTGGAASGKFNVPTEIFELPLGISETDWLALSDPQASPEVIGKSVATIVQTVKEGMRVDSPTSTATSIASSAKNASQLHKMAAPDQRTRLCSPRRKKSAVSKASTVIYRKERK